MSGWAGFWIMWGLLLLAVGVYDGLTQLAIAIKYKRSE